MTSVKCCQMHYDGIIHTITDERRDEIQQCE